MATVAGQYMRVGSVKGTLAIGGAEKKMKADPTFMYLPSHHVAGPEEDVKSWLKQRKESGEMDEKAVRDALKSAYTQSSLEKKAVRDAFEQEISEAVQSRAASNTTKAKTKQVNLMILVKLLKSYKEQKRLRPESVKVVSKANVDIKAKIASLGEGKVLDVTNMKKKGTDTKKVSFKEGGKKKRLSQQEGDALYNVVYDPSNRSVAAAGVKNFLMSYGSIDSENIDKIIASIKEGETVNINRAKSPTRSPLVSPKRKKKTTADVDDILDGL